MEIAFKDSEVIISKEPSGLDNFVLELSDILTGHGIKHVIASEYAATLFGGSSRSESAGFVIRSITFEKFLKLWLELEKGYDCLDTDDPIDAYNGYLRNQHAIRIAKKGSSIPDVEVRFVKNDVERFSLRQRRKIHLGSRTLFISPLEVQIPYMLSLGSEEDIEDARFLFRLFKGDLNAEMFERFLKELGIPEESADRYLGRK